MELSEMTKEQLLGALKLASEFIVTAIPESERDKWGEWTIWSINVTPATRSISAENGKWVVSSTRSAYNSIGKDGVTRDRPNADEDGADAIEEYMNAQYMSLPEALEVANEAAKNIVRNSLTAEGYVLWNRTRREIDEMNIADRDESSDLFYTTLAQRNPDAHLQRRIDAYWERRFDTSF